MIELKSDFDRMFAAKRTRFAEALGDKKIHHYFANHDRNRWNMLLESDSAVLKSQFFADKSIFDLLQQIFNTDFVVVFLSSDIAGPGSSFQTIHQDGNDFAVALNVPLVDSSAKNGATEIWPGTHIFKPDGSFSRESNNLSDEEIIDIAEKKASRLLDLQIGDATLRDLRLIHRGTPNSGSEFRPYLSAIFFPSEDESVPELSAIRHAGALFAQMKRKALADGSQELQDHANAFGRIFMLLSKSDRGMRPIPKSTSDLFSPEALYLCRFACFEDENLNKVVRSQEKSEELLSICKEYAGICAI
jgi:hypothetical protein